MTVQIIQMPAVTLVQAANRSSACCCCCCCCCCCWGELNIKWSHTRQIIESCGYNYSAERLELMRNTGAPGITSKSSEFINFQRRSRYCGWQTGLSVGHFVRKLGDLLFGLRNGIGSISLLLSRTFYSAIGVMFVIIYSQTCNNASRQSLSCRGQLKCDGTRAETDFVFRRNGRVHLSRRGRQFGRLLAAEVCASAVVMLDTPCSEVVWRVLATHSIHQFPLHFASRASPWAFTFQLESTVEEEFSCHFGYRPLRHRVHGTPLLFSSTSRS